MLIRSVAVRVYLSRLVNVAVVVNGWGLARLQFRLRSRQLPRRRAQRAPKRVQGERSERAHEGFLGHGPC